MLFWDNDVFFSVNAIEVCDDSLDSFMNNGVTSIVVVIVTVVQLITVWGMCLGDVFGGCVDFHRSRC